MKIEKITPLRDVARFHSFDVTVKEGTQTWVINVSAHILLDYQHFRCMVLEATGRLYNGEGIYENWSQEVNRHLTAFWATNTEALKRDQQVRNKIPMSERNDDHVHDDYDQLVS